MAQAASISVLVVISDEATRARLRAELEARCEVVADAESFDTARARAIELVPDVVLVDDRLGRDALGEFCFGVLVDTPATHVVALVENDDDVAYETLLQGAFSLVPRESEPGAVVDSVIGAARGESVLTAGSARRLLEDLQKVAAAPGEIFARTLRLTRTEEAVLARLAQGATPAEVAELHDVTARLVNLHTGYATAKVHHHAQRVRIRDAFV
jgi:DNA-binding NarL/FixJ family response regulator